MQHLHPILGRKLGVGVAFMLIIQSLNINATPTPNLRPKIETLDLQLLVTNVTADLYGFNFLYRVEFSRVLIFAE